MGIHDWKLFYHPDWKRIRRCRVCCKTQTLEYDMLSFWWRNVT